MNTITTLKKRVTSVMLAVVMTLSMIPVPVSAAGETAVQAAGDVVELIIGSETTGYTDIREAFDAIPAETTASIRLLQDTTIGLKNGEVIGIEAFDQYSRNIDFDLNGFTLSQQEGSNGNVSGVFYLHDGNGDSNLTIRDSSEAQSGKIVNPNDSPAVYAYTDHLTIEGGTIESKGDAVRGCYADMTIKGGVLNNTLYIPSSKIFKESVITLLGGKFSKIEIVNEDTEYQKTLPDLLGSNRTYRYTDGSAPEDINVTALENVEVVEGRIDISYLDENDQTCTIKEYTPVEEDTTELTDGFYVVKGVMSIDGNVTVAEGSTPTLILCDNARLTINGALQIPDGTTLNLLWQTYGLGTLKARIPSGTLHTHGDVRITDEDNIRVELPAEETVTVGRCWDHSFDAMHVTCTGDGTHAYQCEYCGATEAEECTFGEAKTPCSDGLTHGMVCEICGYEKDKENHSFDDSGACSCGAYITADYNGTQYASIQSAVNAAVSAQDGGTVTLLRDSEPERVNIYEGTVTIDLGQKQWNAYNTGAGAGCGLYIEDGNVTLQNGCIASDDGEYAYNCIELNGGSLTLGKDMIVVGGSFGGDYRAVRIVHESTVLKLEKGAALIRGLEVPEDKTLADYLPEGMAFIKCNYTEAEGLWIPTAAVYYEYITPAYTDYIYTGNMAVVAHTHNLATEKCVCGLTCEHNVVDGVCTRCGSAYAAKRTTEGGEEIYMKSLYDAFQAAESGDVITLFKNTNLNNGEYVEKAEIKSGKSLTLDLNGYNVTDEPMIWLGSQDDAAENGKLAIKGKGDLVDGVIRIYGDSTLDLNGWTGDKLAMVEIKDLGQLVTGSTMNGEISELPIWTENIPDEWQQFASGTFGMILNWSTSGTLKISSLLAKGYAFRQGDGYVEYTKTLEPDFALENVQVVKCTQHNVDETTHLCTYCGSEMAAQLTLGDKKTGTPTVEEALTLAQTDEYKGCTVKLYRDYESGVSISTGSFILDADGYSVNSLYIESGAELTIIDGNIPSAGVMVCGTLNIQSGTYADVRYGEGSDGQISGGTYDRLRVTDKKLSAVLADGYAFAESAGGNIVNGYETDDKTDIKVVTHTHDDAAWDLEKHEKYCVCGAALDSDDQAPVIVGITDGDTYYTEAAFRVTDSHAFTVTVDGDPVQPEDGIYKIKADNKVHKIVATDEAGNSITYQIEVLKLYTVTMQAGKGCTITGEATVGHGSYYRFMVQLAKGYSKTADYRVLVNGEELAALGSDSVSSSHLISDVTEDITITVEGVADITQPGVYMTARGYIESEEEEKTVSSGQFYAADSYSWFDTNDMEIQVSAADAGSGLAGAAYLVSAAPFADEAAAKAAEGWNPFTLDTNGEGSFTLTPNTKGYVYVKVGDQAGNERVICLKEGVALYTDSTLEQDKFTYIYKEGKDIKLPIRLNGNTVAAITDAETELIDSSAYSIDEDGKPTLKAGYLDTLSIGNYVFWLYYYPQGVQIWDRTAAISFTVEVEQTELTVTGAQACDRLYDGTDKVEISGVTLSGKKGEDDVSVNLIGLSGTVSGKDAGTYDKVTLPGLLPTGADSINYKLVQPTEAVTLDEAVTIGRQDAQIALAADRFDKRYGDEAFALNVTENNPEAEPVYTVTDGAAVIDVDNGMVTIKKAGTATVKVSLPESTNYNASEDKTITVNVAKKTGYVPQTVERSYLCLHENEDSIDLTKLLPSDCGAVTYAAPAVTGAVTCRTEPTVTDGVLAYTVNTGEAGEGTIRIAVSTENYADFTVTVHIRLLDRIETIIKEGTEVTLKNAVLTYGETLSKLEFDEAVFTDGNGNEVKGTLAWQNGEEKPLAGTTSAKWIFTPSEEGYVAVEGEIAITVKKSADTPKLPGNAISVPYGVTKLSEVTLPENWAWQAADKDTALTAGKAVNVTAVYCGADAGNYEVESVVIAVTRLACEHKGTELKNAKAATYTQTGYTGDTCCKECGAVVKKGAVIPMLQKEEPVPLKKGTKFTAADGAVYRVLSEGKAAPTVTYYAAKKNVKGAVTVPATIEKDGITYKVTAIAARAFYNCKNLKSVTIGENVTSIGKKAFYNCKKLKKVTIRTTKLTKKKIGASAFKNTAKKITFKLPAKKYKTYKKILKKKGVSKKAVYKK